MIRPFQEFRPSRRFAIAGLLLAALLPAGCGGAPSGVGSRQDCLDCCDTGEPAEKTDYNLCKARVRECPHLGTNDPIHAICADGLPHNVAWDGRFLANSEIPQQWFANPERGGRAGLGCDVELAGRQFDWLSWDSKNENPAVWEIKTATYANQGAFQRQCKLREVIKVFLDDCARVAGCNKGLMTPEARFRYAMALSDQELFRAVTDYLAQHPEELPPGGAEACFTVDAQACR